MGLVLGAITKSKEDKKKLMMSLNDSAGTRFQNSAADIYGEREREKKKKGKKRERSFLSIFDPREQSILSGPGFDLTWPPLHFLSPFSSASRRSKTSI